MADHLEQGVDVTSPIKLLFCRVVTPESTVLEMAARFVALPLADGEIGIAPGHTPLIGRLGYGELRAVDGVKTVVMYLDGGFVEVVGNEISVLTNRAVLSTNLEIDVIEEQLKSALAKPANSDELLTQRERLQLQARAQLRVARHGQSVVGSTAGH